MNQLTFTKMYDGIRVKGDNLDRSDSELKKVLIDMFYNSKSTIKRIWADARDDDDLLDLEGFSYLAKKYCPSFNDSEKQKLFKSIVPKRGGRMTYVQFKNNF